MTDSYIEKRRKKLLQLQERENFIFGVVFGFILIVLNLYIFLSRYDIFEKDRFNILFMALGLIIILMAIIYPNLLNPIHNLFKLIFNLIGKILMNIILIIVYFVLVFPIGLIMQKKYAEDNTNKNSNFVGYDGDIELSSKNRFWLFRIFKVFKIFTDEKYMLMLPLIIVLLLISILFIFVQSSVVAPFIYTLF